MSGHTPPALPQIPQLGLQQISPAGQVTSPQLTQAMSGHKTPTLAQRPQLLLQQYSPAGQLTLPHGAQVMSGHRAPTLAQRLQPSLQQYSPAGHIVVPHLTPFSWGPANAGTAMMARSRSLAGIIILKFSSEWGRCSFFSQVKRHVFEF